MYGWGVGKGGASPHKGGHFRFAGARETVYGRI